MFYLVGLKEDGQLALCDRSTKRHNEEMLKTLATEYHYVQMLLFDDNTVVRYEFNRKPKLREVPHLG